MQYFKFLLQCSGFKIVKDDQKRKGNKIRLFSLVSNLQTLTWDFNTVILKHLKVRSRGNFRKPVTFKMNFCDEV